jgi:HEAT repeat protein
LARYLTDDRVGVRMSVARALGRLGPRGTPAVPGLTDCSLKDRYPDVRELAAEALRLIRLDQIRGQAAIRTPPSLPFEPPPRKRVGRSDCLTYDQKKRASLYPKEFYNRGYYSPTGL